ncbi:helicase [Acanthocystis turfacea Chlorella virus Can0610SP]|nr:helicase [Acanthocystis turfacea Chlorella virus Can0610SP]
MSGFVESLGYELDQWQKDAIGSMTKGHSVFAAVPTGSGKTVLAEYAATLGKKVIYTAPLKAISNQKYHDFSKKFPSVGIITGDIQINEDADLLVMTQEVFRKMIGAKDPRLADIEWVVFDEIHYMSDDARGTVWEESLILIPDDIRCVFLSATVPNARDFASWFSKMHSHPVDVFSISKRPVPLTFHVATDNDLMDISAFDTVKSAKPTIMDTPVVELLKREDLLPAIVFSCSKTRIEAVARKLSKGDLVTTYQSNAIKKKFDDLLRKTGATEFYMKYRDYAAGGVGVHHAGMMPHCKEIIEHLFCSGMLPVLVSTETFAMGVNGPARTVVFESLEKFDGHERRMFQPHEFIQMAGRAGRRGFDTNGHVVVLHDPTIPRGEVSKLSHGTARPMKSSLAMTPQFAMQSIQRSVDIENVIKSSFDSFTTAVDDAKSFTAAKAYQAQTIAWRTALAHPSIWPYLKGCKCLLENGMHGTITEARPAYRVLGDDGEVYTSGITEIINAPFKKMKLKDMDVQLAVAKLKTGHAEKPEDYVRILDAMALDEHQRRLLGEYRDILSWLEKELLVVNGALTPLGDIVANVNSMCPVAAAKVMSRSTTERDALTTIATFCAERTQASGQRVKFSLEEYTPKNVDWNLVRAALDWLDGFDMDSICKQYNQFEGNVMQCFLRIKNVMNELISADTDTPVLEEIMPKIDRDCLKIKSLYL